MQSQAITLEDIVTVLDFKRIEAKKNSTGYFDTVFFIIKVEFKSRSNLF